MRSHAYRAKRWMVKYLASKNHNLVEVKEVALIVPSQALGGMKDGTYCFGI